VGRFEATAFDPLRWKPEYPNTAFDNMRPDDAFWAARIVSRFSDAAIRGVVSKARYTDPRATDYLTATLAARRDKVVRAWIGGVNPLADFVVDDAGQLTFTNAAVDAGAAAPPEAYEVDVSRFDNLLGTRTPMGSSLTVGEPRVPLPPDVVALGPGEYLEVRIATIHPLFKAWRSPVIVHMRRTPSSGRATSEAARAWETVGVRRVSP
jgi:hypothetical protein